MSATLADVELNELYRQMMKNARLASGSEYAQDIAHAIMLLARKIDELKQAPAAEIARLKQVIAHCDVCQHYELLHEHLAREHI